MLRDLLAHPLTRGLDINDPRTTELRREIINQKPFYRRLLAEWYGLLSDAVPDGEGGVLELGSGAGFFREFIPDAITSDVVECSGIDRVIRAEELPFEERSLRAIVMTDVLHHIPDVKAFFNEAVRCLREGGVIAMVEPWVSTWSHFVYKNLHYEPYDPKVKEWHFPSSGPLSGANEALPWIVFERDRAIFESEFPCLRISEIRRTTPFRFLVAGGVSMRSLSPRWSYRSWSLFERMLSPFMTRLCMFAFVHLTRRSNALQEAHGSQISPSA